MRPTRQLLACSEPGCTRRFWRKRNFPWDRCPRCRAVVSDREQRERAIKQRAELIAIKAAELQPDKALTARAPTIPEREALILQWMRAG